MSAEGTSWAPTPRQYRPTYTHLPTSVSMSNFGYPSLSKATPQDAGNKRRRTTSIVPAIDVQHSAPTVASYGLNASASSNDISSPTSKSYRLSLEQRVQTPSGIPSPVFHLKSPQQFLTVSTPVFTKHHKENVLPTTHRLLGPIQPGPPLNATLTKSRTMSAISSLTSTLSRSSHRLVSSRTSFGNLSSQAASTTTSTSRPLPVFTTNIRQVSASMPTAYWLGRFSALQDRFRADSLDDGLDSRLEFLNSPNPRYLQVAKMDSPSFATAPDSPCQSDEQLSKRIFTHLEALCTNNEARKSLKAFRQAYARKFDCEGLLPQGGSMVDREPGIMAKAGRLFSNGRKGSFGMARRRSMLGFAVENADLGETY